MPMIIVLEPPVVVAERRAVEMAARLQRMGHGSNIIRVEEASVGKESIIADPGSCDEAAWAAASAQVACIQAEKAAAERKAHQAQLTESRNAHSEIQNRVISTAMARIQTFKKRRMALNHC